MSDATLPFGARCLFIAASASTMAIAAPVANAKPAGSAFIASAVVNVAIATNCRSAGASTFTSAQTVGTAALISRPRTREMSALEKMRQQQAGNVATVSFAQSEAIAARPSYMPAIAALAETSSAIVPGAVFGVNCASVFEAARPGLPRPNRDFLESRIVPVGSTAFDAAWKRVAATPSRQGVAHAAVLSADAGRGEMVDRIAKVNTWVNRKVAYRSDVALYGRSDYWATIGETLRRGQGDCEDYAIAKMEILAAMGVAREDMYLTLARDLVRRADHAVLIVKLGDRSILLDNASDDLLDGDVANDYRPILSFNAAKRFLHGY